MQADRFRPSYVSSIRAGERAGNLSGVLAHLVEHSARMAELRSAVRGALAYPLLVVGVLLVVLVGILLFIVPGMEELFWGFGAKLPALTMFWIRRSRSLRSYPEVWAGVFVFLVAGVPLMLRVFGGIPRFRRRLDRFKLRVPLFGRLWASAAVAQFSRTLGLLLASRVPIQESMVLAGAAADNLHLEEAVAEARKRVEEGETIANALEATEGDSRMASAGWWEPRKPAGMPCPRPSWNWPIPTIEQRRG